ncbi:MAG: metal ABC transporter ATP-binding protein [Myxococcota bacterium]|nr:metal ABC transporter ATP-binding protein [Myxococcota bacterium]
MKPASKDSEPLIVLDQVAIGYKGRPLLNDINLDIRSDDFLAIVGPNGAGKTTLLKTILGICRPLGGNVWRRPDLRLGYVPQRTELDLIYPLTAIEVVRLGGLGQKPKTNKGWRLAPATRDQALAALEQVEMIAQAPMPMRDLSSGQQQRVLIARGLVRSPDVLILDEPTAGMDLPSERALLDFITHLNQRNGTPILMVVHQMSLVAGRASKMSLIDKDRGLFVTGSAEALLTSARLTDLYGHPMEVTRVDTDVLVRALKKEQVE